MALSDGTCLTRGPHASVLVLKPGSALTTTTTILSPARVSPTQPWVIRPNKPLDPYHGRGGHNSRTRKSTVIPVPHRALDWRTRPAWFVRSRVRARADVIAGSLGMSHLPAWT
jgi:hypothetical protein